MIKRIIRFSAENRILVVAAVIVALAGAWWTMRNIPLDALPGGAPKPAPAPASAATASEPPPPPPPAAAADPHAGHRH